MIVLSEEDQALFSWNLDDRNELNEFFEYYGSVRILDKPLKGGCI